MMDRVRGGRGAKRLINKEGEKKKAG